jgi:hypothetical protein
MTLSAKLTADLPGLLANPSAVMASIEQSPELNSRDDLWSHLSSSRFRDELVSIGSSPRCPPDFVEWCLRLGGYEEANAALARNAALPLAQRRQAFCRTSIALAGNNWDPGLGEDFKRLLCRAGLDLTGEARDPHLTPAEFQELRGYGGVMGSTLLLAHPGCPLPLLEEGARGLPWEREAAARNPNLPLSVVEEFLARHGAGGSSTGDHGVLVGLAQHPLLPEKVALTWATKPVQGAEALRRFLSCNPRLSAKVFSALAKSPSIEIRVNLAANPGIPEALRRVLARDASPKVRKAAEQALAAAPVASKETVAKKPVAKKPVAKKPAAKKPVAKPAVKKLVKKKAR